MIERVLLILVLALPSFPSISVGDEAEAALRDAAFRIDLSRVDVTLDLDPKKGTLSGRCRLTFRMRPGQTRPLFHFAPPIRRGSVKDVLTAVRLNGRPIDYMGAELCEVRFPGSWQPAFEVGSELAPEVEHELEVCWRLRDLYELRTAGRFHCEVDDTAGVGNERLWPTINAPGELARHQIRLRIHDRRNYTVIASGRTTRVEPAPGSNQGDVQVFLIDSGREIASYTLMIVALPASDVQVERFEVAGIPIRIVSDQSASRIASARSTIERTLPRLIHDFGPYPAPSLQVFLTDWDEGMEYYGGAVTGIDALEHELVHLYWGTSAVGRSWRDTWLDEAIAVWWAEPDEFEPLPNGFASNLVSGRSPIEPGFDLRAYDEGAAVIAEIADVLGGRQAMLRLLKEIHARRSFKPFSTREFLGDLLGAAKSEDLDERMERWLFAPSSASPIEVFDSLWKAFHQNYAFFERRGVDWTCQYEKLRPQVEPDMSDSELFLLLCELLRPLGDAHVTLDRIGGPTFSAEVPCRIAREFDDRQLEALAAITRTTLREEGFGPLRRRGRRFRFATNENLGYLQIRSFGGAKKRLSRRLDRVMDELSDCRGLMIDVRGNPGGRDAVAYLLASRFTDEKRVGHIKLTKQGVGEDNFGAPEVWWLEPQGPRQFTRPIALLTDSRTYSAAEVFTLAMSRLPHVTIVGERTNGVFSDMFEGTLPNGWSYTLSHQRYLSAGGICWEGEGVPVDLAVANTTADLETRCDPVILAAIRFLETSAGGAGAEER